MVKRKKVEYLDNDRDFYRMLAVVFAVMFISTLFLSFGIMTENKNLKEDVTSGMNQAEFNCAKLLCEKNDCKTIQIITEVQNYCKSLVYGTDFYMKVAQ